MNIRAARDVLQSHAGTVMLLPDERFCAALVADTPGDWMFLCLIIAHRVSGMMELSRIA